MLGGYYYGLVEVCFGGIWSKICRDTFWDHKEASVICKELGFSPYGTEYIHYYTHCVRLCCYYRSIGSLAVSSKWFSDQSRPIFFNGMECNGNEDHIINCTVNELALDCSSSSFEANVVCPGTHNNL